VSEIRYIRNEKQKLERELDYLTKDMDRVNRELTREKDITKRLEQVPFLLSLPQPQELTVERRTNEELEREKEIYKGELLEAREQLSNQKEKQHFQEVEDRLTAKLHVRFPPIPSFPGEEPRDRVLPQGNLHVNEGQCGIGGKNSIDDARHQSRCPGDRIVRNFPFPLIPRAKGAADERNLLLGDLQGQFTELEQERDQLLVQIHHLEEELLFKTETEEKLWKEFNSKISEWKKAVEARDLLISEKDLLIVRMKEELETIQAFDQNLGQYEMTFEGMKRAITERGIKE
jgi:hypothetical protein